MSNPPLSEVITAIEASVSNVTRRVSFFESDGVTPWLKPGTVSRLEGGSVSVDYTRDERRSMDLLLDNSDGLLSHDSETGFWYDKIIKVYRGINYTVAGVSKSYETTIGTFMIDRIGEDYFPNQVKVTGRDYTKKLILSKIPQALILITGTSLETLINAVAANGGVTDTRLNLSGAVLNADLSFEKSTSRWDILKQICDAYQLEIFVDPFGTLVVRPFLDPLLSPTSLTLKTGIQGNLASYAKSSNDSRIFNHVTVTCDNQDLITSGALIFGEALNNEPSSPTRISRLGDRTYPYVSSVITDQTQANALAQSFLAIMALEEFDLNFDTLVYPWIEAGEIFAFTDSKAGNGEPNRFLLSNFNLPLTLGTMSGLGRRVTIVGPGSTPGDPLFSESSV